MLSPLMCPVPSLPGGKQSPYEYDIRVPFVVRGPGVPQGVKLQHLVGNIDLLPTFVELAGGTIPTTNPTDGISFAKLLRPGAAATIPEEDFRTAFLIEKIPLGRDTNTTITIVQPSRRRLQDATSADEWFAATSAAGSDGEGFLDPLAEFRPVNRGLAVIQRSIANDALTGSLRFPNCINDGSDVGSDGRLSLFQCGVLYSNFLAGSYSATSVATHGRDSVLNYVSRYGFDPVDYVVTNGFAFPTTYYALRVATSSGHFKYIRFPAGYELYNLTRDPYELSNIYKSAPRALLTGLENVLNTMIKCKGVSCTIRGKKALGL